MPTAGERLATLEALGRELTDDLREIRYLLEGGGGVPYERSMRGRLHKIEADVAALLMLRRAGQRLTTRSARVTVVCIGFALAAAPYVLYFLPSR